MFQAMMIVVIGLMTMIGISVKALSANTAYTATDEGIGYGPVKATTHIYRNAFIGVTAGYLRGLVAGDTFMGIAYEESDNSSGQDGDLQVQYAQQGEFLLTGAGFAATDVGNPVFASDDCTLTLTATGNSYIGKISRYVSATQVWVKIDCAKTPALAHANQAAVAAATAVAVTDGTIGGAANGALETVGATNSGDVSAAIMNNFKELQAAVNALITDVADIRTKHNQVRSDLVASKIIKGAA